jgi:phosphotransacetylase
MPLLGFDDLLRDADVLPRPRTVVVAGAADVTVLQALDEARRRGWVQAILVGRHDEIEAAAAAAGVSLDGFQEVDGITSDTSVATVREGQADMLMKGRVSTPELLHAVLAPETGLRCGRSIGQIVLMEIPRDRRRFLLADTGVMIRPNLAKKIDILQSTVAVARALGAGVPRVALVAASEAPTIAMPETIDAAELQRRNREGEFPGCHVQGPLSFDLAYAADAADRKRVAGPVVGAADVMIFPGLAAANLTVKAIMYTADCRFGGILFGTTHPVVFMSRADDVSTRLHSLALALKVGQASWAFPGAGVVS